MRSIIFRGKRVDNGEWVEGYYFHRPRSYRATSVTGANNEQHRICRSVNGSYSDYDVHPETVGQFIGLCDKNGKKIFEGDIIKEVENRADESRIYEVVYKNSTTSFAFIWVKDRDMCYQSASYQSYEVISNIHNSPELLEDKNESKH